jgi:two-component system, chemotaxis family, sensor kinase CheA
MTESDPELSRLLIQELAIHLAALETDERDGPRALRALHALKGSASVAGERDLAAALDRLSRRAREGDDSAFDAAADIVRVAMGRLSSGKGACPTSWPVPPEGLVARPLEAHARVQYAAEVTDRLAGIDEALGAGDDPVETARTLFRHVHTMKGAASAVGDEPMAWFCHGLEEKLRPGASILAPRAAIHEVGRWRPLIGALLDEPATALAMLARSVPSSEPRLPDDLSNGPRPEPPPRASAFDEATATIRVPTADVDRLLDRLDVIDRARERIASRSERGRESADAVRKLRSSLVDALRLIGAPRPWGAPAAALQYVEGVARALESFGDELDAASARLRTTEQMLRDGVAEAKKQLSTMRQTSVGHIFARLTTAIESEARRSGRAVIVRTRGADEAIDRRIAEQLVEPCLQLVRNAVAHGIEPPQARAALGKVPSGTIALVARKIGNRLRLTIADDGAGVDLVDVRARALAAGLVTPAIAESTDDDTLLSLLFFPGFSTRETTDLLAGRGIGLDIARAGIQRMGGAITLSSRAGEGFSARVEVPIESGFVSVLWIRAGNEEFALPTANARRVRKMETTDPAVPHILACLGGPSSAARYAVELDLQADDAPEPAIQVGVDDVGRTDELLIRPLGSLVAGLGLFAGAIVRGDGSLRLAIDASALAPRARALVAAHATTLPASAR